jgi:NTE family protein
MFQRIVKYSLVLLSLLSFDGYQCGLRGVCDYDADVEGGHINVLANAEYTIPSFSETLRDAVEMNGGDGAVDFETLYKLRGVRWFPRRQTPIYVGDDNKAKQSQSQECNVLSMSGGGAFGAVEASILRELVHHKRIESVPDIITGISAGGLNAGFLSYFRENVTTFRDGIERLNYLWETMKTADVYKRDLLKIFSHWSIYNTQPLRETLREVIEKYDTIESKSSRSKHTFIGATNLNLNQLDIFRFEDLNSTQKLLGLIATSAVPLLFPPVEWNGSAYVDGGVIADEIIWQVLNSRECESYNVVVVLANHYSLTPQQTPSSFYHYIQRLLSFLMTSFNSQLIDIHRMTKDKRINITICYPTAPDLSKLSAWNFDNGGRMIELARDYKCIRP